MALDKSSNFAKTTITGIASGATEVVLDDATNFLDPASGEYNCVIWEISNYGNPADDPNKEIVRATALSGSTLTITRAQEGTTASNHNTSGETYAIANVLTKKMIDDIETAVDAKLASADKASASDINTGTNDDKYITSDALAGSNAFTKTVQQICVDFATELAVADGVGYIIIPAECNGMNLISARADVITAGTTNASTFDIYNVTDSTSMLSSAISIASGAKSGTGTVDTAHDDVATGDLIRIDCDGISSTPPKGLIITLAFRL